MGKVVAYPVWSGKQERKKAFEVTPTVAAKVFGPIETDSGQFGASLCSELFANAEYKPFGRLIYIEKLVNINPVQLPVAMKDSSFISIRAG